MADADLDAVIRSIAKTQHKALMDAARKRRARLTALAAKTTDKEKRQHYKQAARSTLELALAAARRMRIAAENAADSYARAVKMAAEVKPAKKAARKPKG